MIIIMLLLLLLLLMIMMMMMMCKNIYNFVCIKMYMKSNMYYHASTRMFYYFAYKCLQK